MSPYSVRMRENADQNHFEYGRFSRSVFITKKLRERSSCLRQLGFQKKYLCEKVAASITASIAALIRSLFYVTRVLVNKIGSLQILISEKCTVPFEKWMAASLL